MIGRFRDNIFVLNKNCEIKNYFKNQFYEIKDNKISIFSKAYGIENGKIEDLKPNVYEIHKIAKFLFSEKINKESFLEEFIYKNDKFIFIHFYNIKFFKCKNFKTEFKEIKNAENFFEDFLEKEFKNFPKESVLLTFNELFFNAYEHGNLGLTFKEKEKLLKESKYMEYLKTTKSDKLINVCVSRFIYKNRVYLGCKITDEGNGFDINQKKLAIYNGRGLLMSDKICDGVFYNEKGNSVLFIKEIR